MKKAKKVICMILALSMLLALAACGGSGNSGTGDSSPTANGTAGDSAANEEKIKLSLWTIYTPDAGYASAKVFANCFDGVKAQFPNITIEHESVENEAYKTKIKTAVAANSMPDIFYAWGGGFSKSFVDAQKVVPIQPYVQDGTLDKLIPGSTYYLTYDNTVYGLPLEDSWVCSLYCNKQLFDDNNIKLPATFSELLDACKKFREAGITPFALGAKDRWSVQFYQIALAIRTAGIDKTLAAIDKRESFDQEAFLESAQLFKQLIDAKAFPDGAVALSNDEVQAEFAAGKYPMMYSGNWMVNVLDDPQNPINKNLEILPFPTLDGGKGDPDGFLGGVIVTLLISATNKYPEQSAGLIKALCEAYNKTLVDMNAGIPSWKVPVDESKMSPSLAKISNLAKKATGYTLAWDTVLEAQPTQIYLDLCQGLLVGSKTPEQFVKELQAAQEAK